MRRLRAAVFFASGLRAGAGRNAIMTGSDPASSGSGPSGPSGSRLDKSRFGTLPAFPPPRVHFSSLELERALDSFDWSRFLTANRFHFAGKRSDDRMIVARDCVAAGNDRPRLPAAYPPPADKHQAQPGTPG